MIKTLFTGSVSACFELDNDSAYRCDNEYSVRLDGAALFTSDTDRKSVV